MSTNKDGYPKLTHSTNVEAGDDKVHQSLSHSTNVEAGNVEPGHNKQEQEFRSKQLHPSTYDALLFATAYLEDGSTKNDTWAWLQFVFSLFLHVTCIFMQFMLTLLLFATVVERSEKPYEHGLLHKISTMTSAVENHEVLDKDNAAVQLCLRDQTLAGAHVIVILLWLSRMLREIVEGVECVMVYYKMNTPGKDRNGDNEIIEETQEFGTGKATHGLLQEKYVIVSLTPRIRWFFILALGGVQAGFAVFLTFTSAKYLILSGNMANVILKAVSMQFIVTLDELLFASFIPQSFAQKIKDTKLMYPGKNPSLKEQWGMAICYVFIVIGLMWALSEGLFPKLADFRNACRSYYVMFPEERFMEMDPSTAMAHALFDQFRMKFGD